MSIEFDNPKIVGARPATALERRWADEAARLADGALPAIRSTSAKWAATVGTLTSIFGIVALIKGRENIAELTRDFEIAVGVLVAAALLFAVVATVLAALAAQGSVKRIDLSGDRVRQLYRREATVARWQLVFSRVTAVVAVLLLGTAIGLTWYGPAEKPQAGKGVTLLAVLRSGDVTCGALAKSPGSLTLKTAAGSRSIDPSQLASLTQVASCP